MEANDNGIEGEEGLRCRQKKAIMIVARVLGRQIARERFQASSKIFVNDNLSPLEDDERTK